MPKKQRDATLDGSAGGLPSSPRDDDLTGRALGDFQLVRKLGQGGMGQVYLARQLSLKREVAVKVLKPDLAANKTALARFQAEGEAVARITHPNIVQIYWIGEAAGLHYMALEFVDGRTLREYLDRKGPPPLAVVVNVMRQVASALQEASERGLVHRDIKPENILLTSRDEGKLGDLHHNSAAVKVADFGLSRIFGADDKPLNLTQSGVTMGTPLYMSPEQVRGQPVDPRSDLYSFGVTSYHMLRGTPPFRGAAAIEVALKHLQDEPEPLAEARPDVPPELCALVHRMMAKRPEDRPQSAREVLRSLSPLLQSLTLADGNVLTPTAASSAVVPALRARPAGRGAGRRGGGRRSA